ncbi:ScbA/BarX family gamma-butyrolactone biosynthesis protein [Streptomyces marincola]|uniref:A-factor biosynthesis hotdog domain-containing protein n=1 Tax=Streptomyces marincola TaxID=2878388 RepID=A0A1W7CS53_9ACTN|nr:ScbA/BarX family gamma-butyrolactone biosynthesis protein [Streptomyces marincola]ARQ67577.1 hypothetical protein CAG99_00900 [Streptomyces marincola]
MEHLHLTREDNVLVTGYARLGPHTFLLSGRWPRDGAVAADDPRVLTQVVRQSGLAVAHAEYGVPLHHRTLLHSLDFSFAPAPHAAARPAAPLLIEADVLGAPRPGRTLRSLAMAVRLMRDGVAVVEARARFGWVSPAVYRRLRGDRLAPARMWGAGPVPAPAAPGTVGRARRENVVLAPGPGPRVWRLRADMTDTLLFDHPVDHVPGLVLVEAALQAAHAHAPGLGISTVACDYERFAELDTPCWIVSRAERPPRPDGRTVIEVEGTQGGRPVFRVAVDGTLPAAGAAAPPPATRTGAPAPLAARDVAACALP